MENHPSGLSGVECVRELAAVAPKPQIVMLTSCDDSDDVSPLEHGRTHAVPTQQFEPGAAAALLQLVGDGTAVLDRKIADREI